MKYSKDKKELMAVRVKPGVTGKLIDKAKSENITLSDLLRRIIYRYVGVKYASPNKK